MHTHTIICRRAWHVSSTFEGLGDVLHSLLVHEDHGRLGGKREGTEVIPAVLGPAHKQPQGGVQVRQVQATQTLVLRLGDAGGRVKGAEKG